MFRKIAEGDIFHTTQALAASGPRTAILPDGNLICTFMLNSRGGANDFVPMVSYSKDGYHWSESKQIWPELAGKKSYFASVRSMADSRISIAGMWFSIEKPGESFWSDEVGGMKENQLAFSISEDGYNFPFPRGVELPYYGSAEQPGGMLGDADGTLTMIYAPYPTIEQHGKTDTCCMVMMQSKDGGKTFTGSKFAQVPPPSEYAESWVVRLTDGRLMVSTWQTASEDSNQYLLSSDDGVTFSGPFAQPFRGQSTGMCAWKDNTVLIAYNQRKTSPVGVWLAMERPDESGVHLLENEPVWLAQAATLGESSGDFDQWTDFSFGEPHVTALPDDTFLVTLWYQQGDKKGIRYIHLQREAKAL